MLAFEGRLAEALPVRPLVPAEGLLVVVGRLVLVLPLTRPVVFVAPVVGRPLTLPATLPEDEPVLPVRPDRLPPF